MADSQDSSGRREGSKVAFTIAIPRRSLVVLIGPPGCGKSTFAQRHFPTTAVVSSDVCRKIVSDSEANQAASRQAFDLMETIIDKRMELGRLVVADAMHITPDFRLRWLNLARRHDYPAYALVFRVPADICVERDSRRARRVGLAVIESRINRMPDTGRLLREGFQAVWELGPDALDQCRVLILPQPLPRRRPARTQTVAGPERDGHREPQQGAPQRGE